MKEAYKKIIMLVDDNMTNLKIGREILKEKYTTYPVPSADTMFYMLKMVRPDMILLDIEMPEMNGFDALRMLKAEPEYEDIPVLFLTGNTGEKEEQEGLRLGAIGYIFKPFSPPVLLKRIEDNMMIA